MPDHTLIAVLITSGLAAAGFIVWRLLRKRPDPEPPAARPAPGFDTSDDMPASTPAAVAYANEATEEIASQTFKLAFGVSRFDYQIFAEHADVLGRVAKSIGSAVHRQDYFPRRPLLLPKLLQALNDTDSTRRELVQLILEDPTLANTTLKRANNAAYRTHPQPIESLDRAIAVLGIDGLRSLLATAILQPVFRLPKGFFDRFAEIAWEQAQRSSVSAETYAKQARNVDPFVAQLLGVMRSLASIVLFRLTLDKYRESPNCLPRPEVFIRVIQTHRDEMTTQIAQSWGLSDVSLNALDEQRRHVAPTDMSELGRAIYYGELCGAASLAAHHGLYSTEGAQAALVNQGLAPQQALLLMRAADGQQND